MLLALPAESRVCPPSQLNLGNCLVSAQQNLECHPDSSSFVSTVLLDLCYALHSLPAHRRSTFPFNFPYLKPLLAAVETQSTTDTSYSEFS